MPQSIKLRFQALKLVAPKDVICCVSTMLAITLWRARSILKILLFLQLWVLRG